LRERREREVLFACIYEVFERKEDYVRRDWFDLYSWKSKFFQLMGQAKKGKAK